LSVRFLSEEASESCASWNGCLEYVGCPDPGSVHNVSRILWARLSECSQFDSYRWIVGEKGIRIVVAPGFITNCDQPVETID
jgi:hypothetical protein